MKWLGIVALAGTIAALGVLLPGQQAQAAKTSIVEWLEGRAPEVQAAPRSHWVAAWSEHPTGEFTLWVVNTDNGKRQEVTKSKDPGGLCWIPYQEQLFYCKGAYVADINSTRVTYYVYDPETAQSTKITHVVDVLPAPDSEAAAGTTLEDARPETFKLLPVAAEDGSLVFHMTLDVLPSFNIYFPNEGVMRPMPADANIGADFDLSSDGKMLYWPLTDPEGNPCFVGWDLYGTNESLNNETWNLRISSENLPIPADGGGMLKVDTPNERLATLAWSQAQPRLQLYVFGWNEPGDIKVRPYPVMLQEGEEIRHYDWKGISGEIYAVVHNTVQGTYSIEVIDPLRSERERLVWGTDEISYVDYASGSGTYYYSIVDIKARTPRTAIVRIVE